MITHLNSIVLLSRSILFTPLPQTRVYQLSKVISDIVDFFPHIARAGCEQGLIEAIDRSMIAPAPHDYVIQVEEYFCGLQATTIRGVDVGNSPG
jgi:hypothetical protein